MTEEDNGNETSQEEDSKSQNRNGAKEGNDSKNWLEWTFVVLGAIVFFGLGAYLVHVLISEDLGDAEITAGIVETEQTPNGTRYTVEVRNDGRSAENVKIELCDDAGQCVDHVLRFMPLQSRNRLKMILSEPVEPVVPGILSYTEM